MPTIYELTHWLQNNENASLLHDQDHRENVEFSNYSDRMLIETIVGLMRDRSCRSISTTSSADEAFQSAKLLSQNPAEHTGCTVFSRRTMEEVLDGLIHLDECDVGIETEEL